MASVLNLPGTSGNYASTPDHSSLDITGDLDIRADVALDDWTPTAPVALIAKWNSTGNQRSYRLMITSTGSIQLQYSTNGTTSVNVSSTSAVPAMPDGGRITVRATIDVDNGASGRTVTFYTGPNIYGPWAQLGDPVVTATAITLFSGSAALTIGGASDGTANLWAGEVYAAQVRSGIAGSVVASPDFTKQTAGAVSFTGDGGKVWTINGTATIGTAPAEASWRTNTGRDVNREVLQAWSQRNYDLDAEEGVAKSFGSTKMLNGVAHDVYGSEANQAFGDLCASIRFDNSRAWDFDFSWSYGDDWDNFTENAVSNTSGATISLSPNGFTSGDSSSDDDRRLFILDGFSASDMEAHLTYETSGAAQVGVALRADDTEAILSWQNVFFGATASVLQGTWEYESDALTGTNQAARSTAITQGVAVMFGTGSLVTCVTTEPHLLRTGQTVLISTNTVANQAETVTVTAPDQFTYVDTEAGFWTGTYSAGGTFAPTGLVRTIASRVIGNVIQQKQWPSGEPEPAWEDPMRTTTNTLPATLAGSGSPPPASGGAGILLAHYFNTGRTITIHRFKGRSLD